MEIFNDELFSTISEENEMPRFNTKMSSYPNSTKMKQSTQLKKLNICGCGERFVTCYCTTDDTLLCKPCKNNHHLRCHVENLEHVAKGSLNCKAMEKTIKELTTLRNVFQKMNENKRLKKLKYRQEKKSMLKLSKRWNRLQSTRFALNKVVQLGMDKYEGEAEAQDEVMARKLRWVVHKVKEYLNELFDNQKIENETGIYIVLHRARKDLEEFRNIINEVTEHHKYGDIYEELRTVVTGIYHFENQGNTTLARALKPIITARMSRVNENNCSQPPTDHSKSSHTLREHSRLSSGSRRFRPAFRPQAIRMATFVSSLRSGQSSRGPTRTSFTIKHPIANRRPEEFIISSSSDRLKEYNVSAMSSLHDGKLLALECRNNMLKLFSKYNILITELDLGCSVWDITTIARFEILITCPGEGKLQRVKITNGIRCCVLAKTGYILTQKDCRAISYVCSRIYVSFTGEKPCIKILSKDGIMYRSIEADRGGITLFKNPLYMHVTKLGKMIYLSDFSLQRVAKIDQKGNLLGFIDVSPGWPLGMSMIRDDNLIVAVSGTNDIKMVTRGSSKWHSLIGSRALTGDPCVITVKETTEGKQPKQLYVACAGCDVVKVFIMP